MFGLAVKIIDTQQGTSTDRRFERFPVRIGRNTLNDIQLDSSYVSQFHAVIQLEGDRLHVVDLGSRNGTVLPGIGPIAPNTPVDLRSSNYEFAVWETIFQVALITVDDAPHSRRRGGVHDLAEEMTRPHGTDMNAALAVHLKPLYDNYRESWATLYREIQEKIGTYPAEMRARFCEDLMMTLPHLAAEPDFKRLAGIIPSSSPSSSRIPIVVEASVSTDLSRNEAVALHGLKELASWYLPGAPPLTEAEQVIGFLQAIQDALDVFFKCFVPLRDGYKQFEVQMDIQRGRSTEAPNGVETAKDSKELARAMLDWRSTSGDAPRSIANTFAELMTHQVAILNGVMKGVKSLLSELSPTTLERELEKPSRGRQGLQIGPFRFKQLWDLYVERHTDLSAEDNQAFALIFGPQFAEAYAQFSGGAPPGVRTTALRVPNPQVYLTVAPPKGQSEPPRR